MRSLVITGASGFIGGALAVAAKQTGWRVIGWCRKPSSQSPEMEWHNYHLDDRALPELPPDCEAVVHCAYAMNTQKGDSGETNIAAAAHLRAHTMAHPRARFVFLSSQSAHAAAISSYGRSKLTIESSMTSARDLAIRPGFVVGAGGLYARLRSMLMRLPAIPVFDGGRQPVHPVWIGDVAEKILQVVEEQRSGCIHLAWQPAMFIRDFYRLILSAESQSKPFISAPAGLALVVFRFAERIGLRLPLSSENLLGLRALVRFDNELAAQDWLGPLVEPKHAIALARQGLISHA